jgi:metal-responsive CopG/Arc/MetJ family transcriptional regulator
MHLVLQETQMTLSLRLDNQLTRRLAAAAKAKGFSKSELIRTCLDRYLADEEQKPTAWGLGKHLFGRYDSGQRDLSGRAKEIARKRIHARRAKKSRG